MFVYTGIVMLLMISMVDKSLHLYPFLSSWKDAASYTKHQEWA